MSQQNQSTMEDNQNLNWFYKIFCWCSGANLKILNGLESEYNKYFGAGLLILLVGGIAMFSGGYAISTIFKESSYIPFIVGPIWGIFIFSLDRYFVSSMIKRGNRWHTISLAIPRLFLAAFLGIVVSRPIELAIFQPEIEDQLRAETDARVNQIDSLYTVMIANVESQRSQGISGENYDSRIANEAQAIQGLQSQIDAGQQRVDTLHQLFLCECKGACGTGKIGYGPVCKSHERNWQLAESQHLEKVAKWQAIINESNERITELKTERDSVNNAFVKAQGTRILELEAARDSLKEVEGKEFAKSLLNRSRALSIITSGKDGGQASNMATAVMLLFILLEITPVLVKLIIPKGPYDDAYVTVEEQAKREDMIKKRLTREEYKLNSLLINRLALSQRDIIKSRLEQWKEKETKEEEPKTEDSPAMTEEEVRQIIEEEIRKIVQEQNMKSTANGNFHAQPQNGQSGQSAPLIEGWWKRFFNRFRK